MKYNRVFRILALAVIFSLLMLALPATPALALVGAITISPTTGPPGTAVTISGTGFTGGSNYTVKFGTTAAISGSCDGTGAFGTSFSVPTNARGQYAVTVTTAGDTSNTVNFTITPQITSSPSSGYVGDTVTVGGTGFTISSTVTIYFDSTSVRTATTNTSGVLSSTTFTVPESYRGTHTVKGTDAGGDSPGVSFTTLQKITVTPTSGAVGDTVTISGNGFAASSTVYVYFDAANVQTANTGTTGTFSGVTFTIPPSSRGSHTIKAQDYSSNYAVATFTVGHKITIAPTSGVSGTTVTVTGSGFSASSPITIKYNAVAVATTPASVSTGANGSFTATFTVLAGLAGTYPVEASDGSYSATANFTATIEVTISPVTSQASPGSVGENMTISGTGFKPNSQIRITYTTEPIEVATTQSDATGAFSATFKVPKSEHGTHTIKASDGTNNVTATFIMESKAPATPKPLLPATAGKAKSKAYFDWEDVTDDSLPVTYTLQIATDKDFKTMVLEKKELTTSEYTLIEAEKLTSTKKDAPYYWRARAIDAASNASDWTTPGTFSVGFIFPEIEGVVLYVLIGAGVLFLFFLGFWVGRKSKGGGEY